MNRIKNSNLRKAVLFVLIFTFISFDISYAYPPEHNARNSTLAAPSVSQQTPVNEYAARLQQSVFAQRALIASVCDIGDYFFGNADKGIGSLPSKYAEDAMGIYLRKHLNDTGTEILNIVPVEHIKKTAPEKLKTALDEIGFKGTLPDEGVIFILCKKGGNKFLVQIAKKGEVSPADLPGYEWVVSDKYLVKYVPEEHEKGKPLLSLRATNGSESAASDEVRRKKDLESLIKEVLSTTGQARGRAIRYFLEIIASCPHEKIENLLQNHPLNLSSSESCYVNILIAGGILRGLSGNTDDQSMATYEKAISVLSVVRQNGSIPKDTRNRLEHYASFLQDMPVLYKLLGYYRKFVSDNPAYFIEALESAVYRARREIKGQRARRDIVKVLSVFKDELYALIELAVKNAAARSAITRSDIEATVSVETAERLTAYDERDIEIVVKLIARLYEDERSKIMPDIIFRADAGMVFSYNGTPYVFLSNFMSDDTLGLRLNEVAYNHAWFQQHKFRSIGVPPEYSFEGSSEIQYVRSEGKTTIIMNHGPRTSPKAIDWIEESLRRIVKEPHNRIEILRTSTITEELAHLSTCLVAIPVIENGCPVRETIMYYPAAFDDATQTALRDRYSDAIILSAEDAKNFAAESVVVGDRIIVDHRISAGLEQELVSRGLKVLMIDLSEFTASGGGAGSLVLPLNKDLFDMSLSKNNHFQIADSAQGVFGVHYVTNPWMRGVVGMTNEKKAEAQRAKLFELMHDNGAVMVPFETKRFSMPFDFSVLSETLDYFMKSNTVQEEFKQTLPALMDKLDGVIGVGSVIGAFPDGSFAADALEEVLRESLSPDEIKELKGVRYLQTLFKRLFMAYQKRYDDPSEFSFSALERSLSLGRRNAVIPNGFSVNNKGISTPEELWPALTLCMHFERFLEKMFDEEPEDPTKQKDSADGQSSADIEPLRSLANRMNGRDNARESFVRFSDFLKGRTNAADIQRYIQMYLTIDGTKDADLAGSSDAVLRCFAGYDMELLYRQFLAWQERRKDAPLYLFFVFYDVFGRLSEGSICMIQETILERSKGTFATSTEVHHRIIDAFANISINHHDSQAAEAFYHIFELGRDFKGGDQLKMAEHIAQVSETLSFLADSGKAQGGSDELLRDIVKAKKYEEFNALLSKRNRESAFAHIGIDYSKFSREEYAHYQSIRKDLDELFSALVINKNFRGHPFRLLVVKLVYVAIIKGDFARIKYEPRYIPSYLETFFSPMDLEKLKVFLDIRKNSRGYRVFSLLERKGILKFWKEDNSMVKGRVPESFDNFIYSVVKDHIERSIEFAPQLQIDIANLPQDREDRRLRAAYLNNLGRTLYRILDSKGNIEDLKAVDALIYDRIVSLPDSKAQAEEVQKTYDAVSREQKLLVMANFRDEVLDADKGVGRTLQGYRDTIAAAVAAISAHQHIAALSDESKKRILPDINDIASIVNFDADRIRPYEKVVDDPEAWKEAMKMVDAIKALKGYLAGLAKKCESQKANAVGVNEVPLSYYYANLANKINEIGAESSGSVEIGNSGDPMIIMKALRGECYDYRDGLNSDVLISMFFNPFIKVGYVRKTSNPDSFLANQVFILSEVGEVGDENSKRVPVVTADFFYGSREYESELADMMLFYKCTPPGIELNVPIEHEEGGGQSGQMSLVQNIIFRDEAWDIFLDIMNRVPVARMTDFERLEKTVLQAPFTADESREYVDKNNVAQTFYDEHIAPRDNFQQIYTKILSDMVRIPSGTGNPSGVNMMADYMASRLKEHGFTIERVPGSEQGLGDHIVFKRIPNSKKPTILFSGHMDTVYTSAAQPAEPEIRQGKIFGPGVMDMKGGLAVMLAVIKKLEEEGLIEEVNIVGVLNSDEERGSKASRKIIEKLVGSYPIGLALVFEFNKHGEVILSRQGIGHFNRMFSDPEAVARLSGIVRNLCLLTDDDSGDRVNAGKVLAIDPRRAPDGSKPVARYEVNISSAAGHAGARKHAGNKDSNFEAASKMDAVEDLIAAKYGGHAFIYHRFIKGGHEVNQLSTSACWIFDIYTDATMDDAAIEKLKTDVSFAARVTYIPETVTVIKKVQYLEESVWEKQDIAWGDTIAFVSIDGEYRFALESRDAALKLRISEFLGEAPKEPHRPVMREHQLAKNILSMVGYGSRGEFNMSAADSNFISNMANRNGERIATFDGLGLTGEGAHSAEQMDEWALLSSLNERTELALSLIKQLLTITAYDDAMSLNSVRKVGIYKEEELAMLSMTKGYALRNKNGIFALQSSNYDIFELSADTLVADRWEAGTAGNNSEIQFPAKWDHSYAMIGENGEIVAALLAYESSSDAQSETGESVCIQYLLIDPRYEGRGIEKDLIIEAAKALNEKGGYRTLPGRELNITCAVNDSNKELLESLGFAPASEHYILTGLGDRGIYSASTKKILATDTETGKVSVYKGAVGTKASVGRKREGYNLDQSEVAQIFKATQLFEIVESSPGNDRAKFVDAGNRLINSVIAKPGSELAANPDVIDRSMATSEIRQRVEKAIAGIESLDDKVVTQETGAAIEFLKKNLAQFEADGAVGSLIMLARKAKKENQKLIIGLETDWIPGMDVKNSLQRQAITALMKEIDGIAEALRSMGLDNVEVIRGSGNQLAGAILTAKDAGNTPTSMRNIIVMASADTINSDSFAVLRNADESDRPFLAGIDPTELVKLYTEFGESVSKQLYIRLVSLLYMTLELAAGKEPPQSPIIVSYDKKLRILMLLPRADLIDYNVLKNTYAAEKGALQAA